MNGKLTMFMIAVAATIVLALPMVVSEGMGEYAFLLMVIIFIATIAVIIMAIK